MRKFAQLTLLTGLLSGLSALGAQTAMAAQVMCADQNGSCTVSNDQGFDDITCSCDGQGFGSTGGNDYVGMTEAELLVVCNDLLMWCADDSTGTGDTGTSDSGDWGTGDTGDWGTGDTGDWGTGDSGTEDWGTEDTGEGGTFSTTGDGDGDGDDDSAEGNSGDGDGDGDSGDGDGDGDSGDGDGDGEPGDGDGDGEPGDGDGDGDPNTDADAGTSDDESGTGAETAGGDGETGGCSCSATSQGPGLALMLLSLLGLVGLRRRESND